MPKPSPQDLSRRERQIMDIIYARAEATAAEVQAALPDAPGYSAVRTLLRLLEEKGHLTHRVDSRRYVYSPTVHRHEARQNALKGVLATFFSGSISEAVASLVEGKKDELSPDEIKRLRKIVKQANKEGR